MIPRLHLDALEWRPAVIGSTDRAMVVAQRRSVMFLLAVGVLAAATAGCTDLKLSQYRDDRFLEEYRYALGEKYIDVGGLRLCYQEYGAGPTLIILPGLGTSIDFWQLNVPVLAEQFHVVPVDLPGFGKSDKPDASYELPWICDRIVAFMDAKGIPKASFIGGSMGGHLALLLALNHPERVDKIIMMGSTGAWSPPGLLLDIGIKLLWNDVLVIDYMRAHWPEIYKLMMRTDSDMTRRIFRYQMANRAAGGRFAAEGRASSRALRSIFYNSCRSRLGDVSVPVLLIWGDADEVHPPDDAFYMRRRMPDARLYLVPDSGHEAMIDQAAIFDRVVTAFLHHGTAGVEDRFGTPPTTRPSGAAQ